jgi:hypothetical protein
MDPASSVNDPGIAMIGLLLIAALLFAGWLKLRSKRNGQGRGVSLRTGKSPRNGGGETPAIDALREFVERTNYPVKRGDTAYTDLHQLLKKSTPSPSQRHAALSTPRMKRRLALSCNAHTRSVEINRAGDLTLALTLP